MKRCVLLIMLSFFLVGFTPKYENGSYRIWVGDDPLTDWIDICCIYRQPPEIEPCWQDRSPIEKIEFNPRPFTKKGEESYWIYKRFSVWLLEYHGKQLEDVTLELWTPSPSCDYIRKGEKP